MKARDNGNIALMQPKCSHTRIPYIGLSYAAMAKIGQLIGVQANESEKKEQLQSPNTKIRWWREKTASKLIEERDHAKRLPKWDKRRAREKTGNR